MKVRIKIEEDASGFGIFQYEEYAYTEEEYKSHIMCLPTLYSLGGSVFAFFCETDNLEELNKKTLLESLKEISRVESFDFRRDEKTPSILAKVKERIKELSHNNS